MEELVRPVLAGPHRRSEEHAAGTGGGVRRGGHRVLQHSVPLHMLVRCGFQLGRVAGGLRRRDRSALRRRAVGLHAARGQERHVLGVWDLVGLVGEGCVQGAVADCAGLRVVSRGVRRRQDVRHLGAGGQLHRLQRSGLPEQDRQAVRAAFPVRRRRACELQSGRPHGRQAAGSRVRRGRGRVCLSGPLVRPRAQRSGAELVGRRDVASDVCGVRGPSRLAGREPEQDLVGHPGRHLQLLRHQ
mmetsp:Transcript_10683/g.25121  ORF Transcript_10683/g.25121 Transcript_10683/m.25121 type:complete len:243 (+) Transcript_10683:891-1619(+)